MSLINVSEYSSVSTNANGVVQIPAGPPLATYDIAVGGASTPGPTLNPATRVIRINTDVTCRVALGVNAVAQAAGSNPNNTRFSAAATEYWGVPQSGMNVAAIQSS